MDDNEVLAVIQASPPRRWMGVGMLAAIGVLVIYVALVAPPVPVWQAFLIVTGGLALWMADRMRRATGYAIELTRTELRDSSGELIARVSDIEKVESGFFAFKPSHGFLVRTRTPATRIWRPGLWWRFGRRIGVGGVTPRSQTKFMAEMLTAMIALRDQASE